jgi:hypothetical protein
LRQRIERLARDPEHARHLSSRDELPDHVRFDPRTTGVDSRILVYGGRQQVGLFSMPMPTAFRTPRSLRWPIACYSLSERFRR